MYKHAISAFTLATMISMGASAQAAYQSQTILRLAGGTAGNGLIQTLPAMTKDSYDLYTPGFQDPFKVKDAAFIYDKRNPLPALTVVGANYAFFAGGVMATVAEDGSFYYKGKTSVQPEKVGGNYFLNKGTSELITIDSAGFYNSTGVIAKNVRLFGGNFYIDQSGVITTIKGMGTAPGNPSTQVFTNGMTNYSSAIRAGGNWFENADGTIVGVSSETGFLFYDQKVDSRPKKIGGNYFIGQDNYLYTIANDGAVKKQMPIIGEMKYFGYSYMIDGDGDFIFVDGKGNPHTDLIRISTTGIKSAVTKKMTETLDSHQNFIPSNQ